ncbi:MAG: DUF1449 domain-containing protein, partial [Rivularia sp. ALOHA_DT_140]|nr:DUF1449 domain-containing protein [Rivularia sp. ALOHA_DT_140]
DVIDESGNLVTINATIPEWATVIPRHGSQVVVIDRKEEIYLAIAKDSPDINRWFRVTNKK